ncbi:MAG: DUF1194 domain-containing protein [Luteolibacter sp.]|uniref:DUF1194 domain-containing protein n=1 Tax=Luteolibacter sp. TaxID=1962973 RepID=UPI003265AE13
MKTFKNKKFDGLCQPSGFQFACALSVCIAATAWFSPVRAETVDSELVLLVDIVQPELSQTNFTRLLNSYANSFTSSQMLNSIQSGATGKIAVSVMLFGGASMQVTGVPWMVIGNAAEALNFANLVRNVTRPTTFAFSDPGAALTAATKKFGTETGGASNGFESTVQIIEVATAGIPSASMATSTANSSANALASGVDLINAVALGTFSNSIDSFYTANVIGSTIPGVQATSTEAPLNGTLNNMMGGALTTTVQTGSAAAISAVPEPSSLLALLPTTLLLLKRRRH